ncbi:MAG: hydrogenase maturation nickel metallochaperone HypA [Dehalococcoidales bacterium]|nr:hydrogenase maturation nickel metallochaperone HypA [Dehalococcoidales bacterium]
MHELAITQSMLDIVLDQAEKAEAERVLAVKLSVGELSGFVEESVQFYFNFLVKGTIAEGATVSFTMVPAKARCRNCARVFKLKEFDWSCPDCGQDSIEITDGKELFVESIEVE